MKEPFPYDVFLSHNQADKPRVRRLAERLRAANLRVWFDSLRCQFGTLKTGRGSHRKNRPHRHKEPIAICDLESR